jgi:hypothetical protein
MAVKVVHVSDVSDREGSQEELGTLEVLEHPAIGEPACLEIFPDEFERSPEHAGEPHRGRITEAEKSYVREHLDQVNKRLRGKGMRTIDANDPTMRERYGLLEQIRY